jgi:Mor family transcriptional regulator
VKKPLRRERRGGIRDRRAPLTPTDLKILEASSDLEFIEALQVITSHPEAAKKYYEKLAEKLMEHNTEFAGETVYIPKRNGFDQKRSRNKKIIAKFTGNNFAELGKEFNLSTRQIRNICCKK